jgi:Ca2+-binding EF-hand superfamily protein
MKTPVLVAAAFTALAFVIPTGAFAAAATGPKAKIFAEFDANKNGVIDGDEVAAVRKAFAADPKGQFARYDADKDGKLSDAEIAEIKPPGAKGKKDGEKKGGKKDGGKKAGATDASKSDTK